MVKKEKRLVELFKKIVIKIFIEDRLLRNVTKRNSTIRRALVCYTVWPFYLKRSGHTNIQEMHRIVSAFDRLGFCVDVAHYTSAGKINYSQYDVIFGFGEPFERSFYINAIDITRVYYGTGAHAIHQNIAEVMRVSGFNQNYKSNILPKRLVPWFWTMSTTFSDFLIILGNAWTASTYRIYTDKPVISLNATSLVSEMKVKELSSIDECKTGYLWFGSSGLIHKGLDLCLEYFSKRPDLVLHVCGPKEEGFDLIVEPFLTRNNIFYHGFVDVNSSEFVDITDKCLFGILPSCSEGQSTSLLTLMAKGLIPVGTIFTGIDIDKYGYVIESLSVHALEQTVVRIESISNAVLKRKSMECTKVVMEQHSISSFEYNLTQILKSCLCEK